jgi:hypothetical protein
LINKNCETRVHLWVPETLHTSRDLLVLVEQSAEPFAPSDRVRIAPRPPGEWSQGSGLAKRAVWPVVVVVLGVLGQHGCGMPRRNPETIAK